MKHRLHLVAFGATLGLLTACGGGGDDASAGGAPRVHVSAADRKAARTKFDTLCFTCHGKTGGGDGPASKGLVPVPRNLQDPQWQASVTDEHIEKIIVGGGAAVGKALTMPSNPDLKGRPGVVVALRELIRDLAKK